MDRKQFVFNSWLLIETTMRKIVLWALMASFHSCLIAGEAIGVFGMVCNERFEATAKRVKLIDLSEKDLGKRKILMHPDFWNSYANDDGFTKFAFALPDANVDIGIASMRFQHGALSDVQIQFDAINDDRTFSRGSARAYEMASLIGKKYGKLPRAKPKSEGFMDMGQYTDWELEMPLASLVVGSRPSASDSDSMNFRSTLMARVRFSEDCGDGRRAKNAM